MSCPILDSQYSAWVAYNRGDTATFINGSGDEISFVVYDSDESPTFVNCGKDGFGGCHCPDCPLPYVQTRAMTKDTSRQYILQGITFSSTSMNTFISKRKRQNDTLAELQYSILGHNNLVTLSPVLTLNNGDSLLANFTIGNINYLNIIEHKSDTTLNTNFVWKSYYSKEYGIIAFYDRKTQSMFYRKP